MEVNGCWRLMTLMLLLLSIAPQQPADAQDRPSLEILPVGENQTKAVGSSILLTCKPKVADIKLITDMKWLNPQNTVIESRKLAVLPLDSKSPGFSKPAMYTELHVDNSLALYFTFLKEEQAGKYICTAQYANTNLLSQHVNIDTIVAITWDDAPENQNPILGEDFPVKCQVRARPSPTVDWLYNGEVIRTNGHYIIETHALKIKNVRESDDGIYTCRASVPETGELQERAIRVEVHTRPSIRETQTSPIEIIEGEDSSISCMAIGKPPPKFSWVKSLTKENLAVADRFAVDTDTGMLRISNARRDDTGEYQCMATNAAGTDTMNVQVQVIVKPKIMEFLNVTTAQGEKSILRCKAFGRPSPSVTFRKSTSDHLYKIGAQENDDRIALRNNISDQKGETIAELTIENTLRAQDGLYVCIANNKGGTAFKNGHLTVEFPPSFSMMNNRTIYTWDSRPVNFSCIAESIPNATISWTFHGDQKVEHDPNIQIYGNGPISYLYVKPLDRRYYTSYKCIAKNKYGEAFNVIKMYEAQKPVEISQATVTETTATTITFDIVPPLAHSDLPIRTLSVQYKKQDTSWDVAHNRTWAVGSSTGYVIENLEPQTTYDFRFAASNIAGRGNWGMHKRLSTTMRNVPGAARFLAKLDKGVAMSHHHDRYNLKWSAAPDNGERIDYYEVKWCQVEKYTGEIEYEVKENTCIIKEEIRQETWITELYPSSYYRVELRAHNILGFGTTANITIRTTKGNTSNAVVRQPSSIMSSAAIIGIVIASLIIIVLIVDAVLCCTNKSGVIYYMCERSRRKPADEDDRLGSRDEKEPLKEEKKITPIIDSGLRHESSVTFDGKRSISKTGFVGKDSAV